MPDFVGLSFILRETGIRVSCLLPLIFSGLQPSDSGHTYLFTLSY